MGPCPGSVTPPGTLTLAHSQSAPGSSAPSLAEPSREFAASWAFPTHGAGAGAGARRSVPEGCTGLVSAGRAGALSQGCSCALERAGIPGCCTFPPSCQGLHQESPRKTRSVLLTALGAASSPPRFWLGPGRSFPALLNTDGKTGLWKLFLPPGSDEEIPARPFLLPHQGTARIVFSSCGMMLLLTEVCRHPPTHE